MRSPVRRGVLGSGLAGPPAHRVATSKSMSLLPQIWSGRRNPLRNVGDLRQWAVQPPSMHNDAPLIRAASGEQR